MRTVRENLWMRNSIKGRFCLISSHLRAIPRNFTTNEEQKIIDECIEKLSSLTKDGVWKNYLEFREIKQNETRKV